MSQEDIKDKVGLPPGTVVHTGADRTEEVTISIMEFSGDQIREYNADCLEDCAPPPTKDITKWIHIKGVHDVDLVQKVCDYYNVHSLIVEDIPSIGQRPKLEMMPSGVYIVLRAYDINQRTDDFYSEQVSIVLGEDYVLSFQETSSDTFVAVREQARSPGGKIRHGDTDYLTYALIDLIVDKYFVVLERAGDIIEDLEDELIEAASENILTKIYHLKRTLLAFRRHIWPLRQVVLKLQRDTPHFVKKENVIYISDLYDHVIRITDHVETYRESITGMLDIYLSRASNRMNEVMQVLTVISTVFIPLTLMASIYGMNWQWIPELEFYYGYPVFIAVMIIVGFSLLAYFRRIRWI